MLKVGMLAVLQALVIAAQPPPVPEPPPPTEAERAQIRWRAPVGCPTQQDLERSVAELAGRVPLWGELSADAVVEQRAALWSLSLTIVSESTRHEQVLQADDCPTLATAAALIVAVMLDPIATVATTTARAAAPEGLAEPVPSRAAPADRLPALSPAPRWQLGLQVGVGGEYAAIPRGTVGARIGLFARRGALELRVDGGYWLPRRTGDGSEPGARVQLGTAAAGACVVPAIGRLQFPACAALEGGGVRAAGVDVRSDGPVTIPWLAVALSPGLRWWVSRRIALSATAEVFAPILRTRLTLGSARDGRVIHESTQAGFRGLLGLVVGFSGFGDGS